MSLSQDDKKPVNISLKGAYGKIRKWYQANINDPDIMKYSYGPHSIELIKALPATLTNNLEIQAVLAEIILGNLEWAYHKNDGNYKMAAYAFAALAAAKCSYHLSDVEKNKVKTSGALWTQYLHYNNPIYE